MKNAPTAVKNYLAANNVGYRADLYTLTLADNVTVYRWTTADTNITIGSNTWLANGAVLRRGNLRSTSRLEVDNLEIELSGSFQIGGKSICLLAVQRTFSGARMQLDHLVGSSLPNAIANGPVLAYFEGPVGQVQPGPLVTKMTVLSDIASLNQMLPRFYYQLGCMNAVYDANCGLVKATFTQSGTASGVPTTTTVPTATAGITANASGYYNLGVLQFTSGALNGVRRSISNWASNTFTLALPLSVAPAAGDAFTVYPGCPRTQSACNAFPNAIGATSNLVNFRGFPHIPAPEAAL